jgi:hypothetical protein
MAGEDRQSRTWRLFQFVVLVLAVRFAWAVLVPGGSWPLPPAHLIAMGIDGALLLAAIALRTKVSSALNDGRRPHANILMAVASVCGLGLLGIRFTSDAAWWTGHLRNHGFF